MTGGLAVLTVGFLLVNFVLMWFAVGLALDVDVGDV